jgi:hypothetical protein
MFNLQRATKRSLGDIPPCYRPSLTREFNIAASGALAAENKLDHAGGRIVLRLDLKMLIDPTAGWSIEVPHHYSGVGDLYLVQTLSRIQEEVVEAVSEPMG